MPAPRSATMLDTFGTLVRDARNARNWDQEGAGEVLGMSQSQVSDLETGKRRVVDAATILRLVEIFGLSLDELAQAAADRVAAASPPPVPVVAP